MNKKIMWLLAAVAAGLLGTSANAEPTGVAVKIKSIRPYNLSPVPAVYIYVSQWAAPCETDTYKIDLSIAGAKEVYAAALSAHLAGKNVRIEAAGCTGWASVVQSIYVDD